MVSNQGLRLRLTELKLDLSLQEKQFQSIRDELKLAKKAVIDTRGAISEIERLLLSAED